MPTMTTGERAYRDSFRDYRDALNEALRCARIAGYWATDRDAPHFNATAVIGFLRQAADALERSERMRGKMAARV